MTPKVAQTLARHSTITLTMDRYTHVALADTSKALASLPALPTWDVPKPEALAATGTHGRENADELANDRPSGENATRANDGSRRERPTATPSNRRNARTERDFVAPNTIMGQPVSSKVSGESSSEADGTRTRNHRIDGQPDDSHNPSNGRDLRDTAETTAAQTAAPSSDAPQDPNLAALIAAWADFPEPVRVGINAMVRAATGG